MSLEMIKKAFVKDAGTVEEEEDKRQKDFNKEQAQDAFDRIVSRKKELENVDKQKREKNNGSTTVEKEHLDSLERQPGEMQDFDDF